MLDVVPPQPLFVGRTTELSVTAASIEAAVSGHPSVVWVEGAAGSGKTTLIRQVLARLPEGVVAVRAHGDELAVGVPFELVSQLGARERDNPFAAGQELLNVWSERQGRGPVAVVIEDVHWADEASSLALMSALRRLDRDRVVVIITSRPGPGEAWDRFSRDEERCRRLAVGSFDAGEVAALASLHGVELTDRQAERLRRHTGGHPLWVRTLLAELSAAQLQAPDGGLPAPRSLASAVTARLGELSPPARDLAAALAVVHHRAPLPVVGQVAGVASPVEAFDNLLATGFVRWEPGQPGPPVEYAHPLYRLAVYEDLSPTRRRDLHRAAAGVLTPASGLAHRVAADGVDDALADELELAAERERTAGAPATAARNLLWAASLSAGRQRSERRLLDASLAFLDSGQPARVAGLRTQVEECADSPLRNLILGLAGWELGESAGAERWLRRAVTGDPEGLDGPSVARGWAQLAEIYVVTGRGQQGVDAAHRALALAAKDTPAERLGWLHLANAEAMLRGGPAGLECLAERLPAEPTDVAPAELDLLVIRATLAYYSARGVRARADVEAVLAMVRRGTVPVQLARCHYLMAALLTNTGEWDDAVVHARTAMSIATDDQLVWMQSQCHAALGTLLAYRGDWDGAEFHVGRAASTAGVSDSVEAFGTARLASAALGRARDQPQRVIEALGDLPLVVPMLSALYFWPPLVSALLEAGRPDDAGRQIEALAHAAASRGIDMDARVLGLRGLLAGATGRPDEAVGFFDAALGRFGPDDPFLDVALLHRSYGRVLQARGDRRPGVDHLRTAHQMLSAVGADRFVASVDRDLAMAGLHGGDRPERRSTLDLTDRERDVALLVGRGMTNPEVAAKLYVSRKAVEYHLSNIYAKLGISTRRELRAMQIPA